MKTRITLLAAALCAAAANADIATEHFFTNALTVAEGETQVTGHFDVYSEEAPAYATAPDDRFYLYKGSGYVSEITTEPTGLGRRWNDFLQNGFYSGKNFTAWSGNSKAGIRSQQDTFQVLHSNRGSQTVGTIYMVFRPRSDRGWSEASRNALFGFGHTGYSWITCCKPKGSLELQLDFTVKKNVEAHYVVTIAPEWNMGSWYFVAASFPAKAGEGNQCQFYLREMNNRGPAFSPEGLVGQIVTSEGYSTYYPPANSKWPFAEKSPLGIGGQYITDGGNWHFVNTLGGDIAYFRADNTYQTIEDFEEVFMSLGIVNEPTTVFLIN